MDVTPLLRKIDLALAIADVSERSACLAAKKFYPDINVDFVRDIRRRRHDPKVGKLIALAAAMSTDLVSLLADYPGVALAARTEDVDLGQFSTRMQSGSVGSGLEALTLSLGSPDQGEFVKESGELALLRFWRSLDESEKREVIRRLGS